MYIYVILFIASVQFARTLIIDTPLTIEEQNASTLCENNSDTEYSYEDDLRKFRIEMVKLQIMEQLNTQHARPSDVRPSEASKEIIRLLMKEEKERQLEPDRLLSSEERLMIHAKKSNMTCLYSNTTNCRIQHFELSQSLTASSVDLWIYKRKTHPKWISIVLPSSTSNDKKPYETLYYKTPAAGWNKLELPKRFIPPSWNESSYMIEISGDNIEYTGELRPFLLVSKLAFTNLRQRREAGCDTNESCCWLPLSVSFAEIGFDWVLYPSNLEANMCTGKCHRDPSSVSTHYEIAMFKLLENNNSVQSSLGECWTQCCKPNELEAVRVFYNDTDGIIHDQYIPDLSVKSCGCA